MRPTEANAAENAPVTPPGSTPSAGNSQLAGNSQSASASEPARVPAALSSAAPAAQSSPQPASGSARPPSLQEPPQLALVPSISRDEPIMATVIGDRPWTGTPNHGWTPGQGLPTRHPSYSSQPIEDPFEVAVKYAKALWSREAQEALFSGRKLDKIYSVPRRFDLSTLFVVSTLFAMLFAVLGALEQSSWNKLSWCFFFSGVGFAQAALYNGQAPRLASVLSGGLILPFLVVAATGLANAPFCLGLGMLILGLPAGYIAGTLIGGVFLVADKLRNWLAQRRQFAAPVLTAEDV